MIFRKTRSARFNMGNYEHAEYFATVEVDTEKDDLGDATDEEVMQHVDDLLDKFTESDLDFVKKTTDIEDSWVFPYSDYRRDLSNKTTNKRG